MMWSPRVPYGPVLFAALTVVAGCTAEAAQEPVPTTAESPFLCDGVPLLGHRLLTGAGNLSYAGDAFRPWDDDVLCVAEGPGGESVAVSHQATEGLGLGSVKEQVEELRAHTSATRIDADAPGEGYVIPDGEQPYGRWVCDDGTRTEVRLASSPPSGRDVSEDLSRYLTSILPWACGDAEAPERTERA